MTITRLNRYLLCWINIITGQKSVLWWWNDSDSKYTTSFFTFLSQNRARRRLAWTSKLYWTVQVSSIKSFYNVMIMELADWSSLTTSTHSKNHSKLMHNNISRRSTTLLSKSTSFLKLGIKSHSNCSLTTSGVHRNLYSSSKKILGQWSMPSILWVHVLVRLWKSIAADSRMVRRLMSSNVLLFRVDGAQ